MRLVSFLKQRPVGSAAILILLLASAIATTTAVSSVFQDSLFMKSLIDESQCELPCWEKVTPSSSSEEQAIDSLRSSLVVDSASVKADYGCMDGGGEPSYDCINWRSRNGLETGQATVHEGKVQSVQLSFHPRISLGWMMQQFGPPDRVLVTFFYDLHIHFYYLDEGLEFVYLKRGFPSQRDVNRTLSDNMKIEEMISREPSHMSSMLAEEGESVHWQGRLRIRDYCVSKTCLGMLALLK